jgi:hypothetical protein
VTPHVTLKDRARLIFTVADARGDLYPPGRFARLTAVLVVESAVLLVALYAIAGIWQATH